MATKKQLPYRSTRRRTTQDTEADAKRRKYFEKYLYYLEGLADYSQANHSYGSAKDDYRTLGWAIGRQIVAFYLIEMLLRIDYERRGITCGTATHNLARLFRDLPRDSRDSVEKVYKRILNNEVEWTWDICRTVKSFLDFLGKNPIAKTRYPWQQQHEGTLFTPNSLRPLIYALYIGLYNYPCAKGSLDKRFNTKFKSLKESRKYRYDSKGNQITE